MMKRAILETTDGDFSQETATVVPSIDRKGKEEGVKL